MNPWMEIELDDYEAHMSSDGVFQLQTLNEIMSEQSQYSKEIVTVLGAAGGNGFEHFVNAKTIYAVDVNEEFLKRCAERFPALQDKLRLICCDLNQADLPPCELLICNLIIEYLGVDSFAALLQRLDFEITSCVIQKNHGNSFVSASEAALKLAPLGPFHHDIDEDELIAGLNFLKLISRKRYELPNNKEFLRLDFVKL